VAPRFIPRGPNCHYANDNINLRGHGLGKRVILRWVEWGGGRRILLMQGGIKLHEAGAMLWWRTAPDQLLERSDS